VGISCAFLLSACAQQAEVSKPAYVTSGIATERATVLAVNRPERMVVLRGEDGDTRGLILDERVKNFDQIEVGDVVTAQYQEETAIFVRPSTGAAAEDATGTLQTARPVKSRARLPSAPTRSPRQSKASIIPIVPSRSKGHVAALGPSRSAPKWKTSMPCGRAMKWSFATPMPLPLRSRNKKGHKRAARGPAPWSGFRQSFQEGKSSSFVQTIRIHDRIRSGGRRPAPRNNQGIRMMTIALPL
jgi:hypothetical protein